LVERLSIELDIRLEIVVQEIEYNSEGVKVHCANGELPES